MLSAKPSAEDPSGEIDLQQATEFARRLAKDQEAWVLERWDSVGRHFPKNRRDFSTEVDITVERRIRKKLQAEYPSCGFSGEESGDREGTSPYRWLVDPIDGTKYYAGRSSLFSISIALLRDDEPVIGVIDSPSTGQMFQAYSGGGAFLDGDELTGPEVTDLSQVIINVETTRTHSMSSDEREWFEAKLMKLARSVYRIRALGVASLAACWVATGALDAYLDITGHVKPQDLAAGRIIMSEAGVRVGSVDVGIGPLRLLAAPVGLWESIRRILTDDE